MDTSDVPLGVAGKQQGHLRDLTRWEEIVAVEDAI